MATVTAQSLINRVLISLRRPTISVTPVTDPYQLLVLEFFNQVKQEVEDETNWRCLWQTINVTIPANGYFGVITGTNERSRLVRVPVKGAGMSQSGYAPAIVAADAILPLVFDITSPTTSGQFPLTEMPLPQLLYNFTNQNGVATTLPQPQFFAIGSGNTDNSQLGQNNAVLYVYPPVNNQRTIQVTMCIPQTDFTAANLQDSSGNANFLAPQYPILMGLQWMCREEKGEELSESGAFSEEKYREVLDDAVGIEMAEQGATLDLVLT